MTYGSFYKRGPGPGNIQALCSLRSQAVPTSARMPRAGMAMVPDCTRGSPQLRVPKASEN